MIPEQRARNVAAAMHARLLRRHPGLRSGQASESLPITLGQRRIYVLPSGFGVGFGSVMLLMLLGALNYNNNAALLLTCVLGAASAQSMYGAFRSLHGLRLESVKPDLATAGGPVRGVMGFKASLRPRGPLRLVVAGTSHPFALDREARATVSVTLHAQRRGWMQLPALKLESTWPFGLFRAWSWVHPDTIALIYPVAEDGGPPPGRAGIDAQPVPLSRESGEEYAGLRDYQPGDPPRRIAWHASARSDTLLFRLHESPPAQTQWTLRWDELRELDPERRIMRLARWVDEAHRDGRAWMLELPQQTLGPDRGSAHFHACMTALAILP